MRVAAASLIAVVLAVALPARGAGPDPYAIYDQAQRFWLVQRYPPYLAYDVAVRVDERGNVRVERYDSAFDATTGSIWVDPVSDYELAHPYVVHGLNLFLNILGGQGVRLNKPEAPVDFLGVPELAPTYTFGMTPFVPVAPPSTAQDTAALVAAVRKSFHDPYRSGRTPPPATNAPALREIAHSLVNARAYTIGIVGEEVVNGHLCYHLALHPSRDPKRYRLRQLWVDERTGATWRLQEALNFVDGPGTGVSWTVNFANVDGAQYIADESSDAPMRYRGLVYSHTVVAFEDIHAISVPQTHTLSFEPSTDVLLEP
jgi:hypothetical protein